MQRVGLDPPRGLRSLPRLWSLDLRLSRARDVRRSGWPCGWENLGRRATRTGAEMLNAKEVRDRIDRMTGEKVTEDSMRQRIVQVDYSVLPRSAVTVCNITLAHGNSGRGEPHGIHPAHVAAARVDAVAYRAASGQPCAALGFRPAHGLPRRRP